ncbi:DUF2577 domain-containing protein [Clostridium botulinum C/D]|uniref:DUF2577 domain-containing protein n=1 Tax=Clostridium botulinum TaxID=1491 RepID=UPI001E5E7DC9|nr:DUF2577 domain-containing protein [Clostridium botulinum]MCD3211828.1 DUF2577 domain-containing protein [Clostridium botulinum C/D]
MGMIDIIKKAGLDAVGAEYPVNILFGEVLKIGTTTLETSKGEVKYFNTHIDKLEIKVEQKLILDKDFFIIPESLTRYEILLKHKHEYEDTSYNSTSTEETQKKLLDRITIREGLQQGDKVLLLRVQGGQRYVILDKVV